MAHLSLTRMGLSISGLSVVLFPILGEDPMEIRRIKKVLIETFLLIKEVK